MILSSIDSLKGLTKDGRLLFATRGIRLFAYGFLSVVLILYLTSAGLSEVQAGAVLTFTLIGDAAVTFWITTHADRTGRRRMLVVAALLMAAAGVVFTLTHNFLLLLLAATVGVISPSGNEVGPFLSIEQASLSHLTPEDTRTGVFSWYNLVGSFATALGAVSGGWLAQALQSSGWAPVSSYRVVIVGYALIALVLVASFSRLSPAVEVNAASKENPSSGGSTGSWLGLGASRGKVLRLALLFSLDAFAGGFVIQSLVAYWFHTRFGLAPGVIGSIFFGANILAGISALSAAWIASRIGLVNTMVFTHLPSNVLLILVPLMPTLPLAVTMLLLRFSISQMDVPTRQSYVMAVVAREERSAASGITTIARSIGASLAPVLTGPLLAVPALSGVPFLISGGLKIVYDLILYRNFRGIKPPEEAASRD